MAALLPRAALVAGMLLTVAGCSSMRPSRPQVAKPSAASVTSGTPDARQRAPATPAPAGTAAAAVYAALDDEQRWLRDWFRGTPVLIARVPDALLVDVPREFCFDPGRSGVKPALAAVLDKLALSLRRRPSVRLALLAAPHDENGGMSLALQRAAQMRAHLRDRGVPARRIGEPSATRAAAVQLRITADSPS